MTDCDHKFVDSTSCLKCGTPYVSLLRAELREALSTIASLRADAESDLQAIQIAKGVLAAYQRNTKQLVAANALLERIVKYANEDRARTPGVTRLARVLSEAASFLAHQEQS